MSISEAKLEASRTNGAKSQGPTSAVGRAKAAQNAIKHGLCGKFFVLQSESQDEYNALLQRFIDAEKPLDDVEYELVAKMARSTWMSERAVRMQNGCFTQQPQTDTLKAESMAYISVRDDLDKFLRYQTTHDRAYARAAAELAKRRKERAAEQRGFVSQQRAEKKQSQQDELFEIRKTSAQLTVELKQITILEKIDRAGGGKSLQKVA